MKVEIEHKEGRWLVNNKRLENTSLTERMLLHRFFHEKRAEFFKTETK